MKKVSTHYKDFVRFIGLNPKTEFKTILKTTFVLIILVVVFFIIQIPPKLWLPFYAQFPDWMVDNPPLIYLPAVLGIFGFLLIVSLLIWFFRRWGYFFDKVKLKFLRYD